MGKHLIDREDVTLSYVAEEIYKHLNTGHLKFHYRANTNFIIREKVLYGFKHEFLDSVEVFTIQGNFIGKQYRIRENQYSAISSKSIVSKILTEYLYSDKNRSTLRENLDQLYELNNDNIIQRTIVNNFIENHEKVIQ